MSECLVCLSQLSAIFSNFSRVHLPIPWGRGFSNLVPPSYLDNHYLTDSLPDDQWVFCRRNSIRSPDLTPMFLVNIWKNLKEIVWAR